jgi:hypothetical protein
LLVFPFPVLIIHKAGPQLMLLLLVHFQEISPKKRTRKMTWTWLECGIWSIGVGYLIDNIVLLVVCGMILASNGNIGFLLRSIGHIT